MLREECDLLALAREAVCPLEQAARMGGITLTLGGDGAAVLSVSDTGIGIPIEHRERIFERFYRVDKSRSKEMGGTGLGLSIVKHAARLHRATVTLQSASGGGSTFTVRFPRG